MKKKFWIFGALAVFGIGFGLAVISAGEQSAQAKQAVTVAQETPQAAPSTASVHKPAVTLADKPADVIGISRHEVTPAIQPAPGTISDQHAAGTTAPGETAPKAFDGNQVAPAQETSPATADIGTASPQTEKTVIPKVD